MKTSPLLLLPVLLLVACSDINVTDMGSQLLPPGDQITVSTDTFAVRSDNYIVPYIYAYPDSFLLGTFYDETYGTTHADIFAQVEKPASYPYPANVTITPDSAYLILYYDSYFGDKYSPMNISVYEMNKETFSYTKPYPSNLLPSDYTDKSILIGKKTITAVSVSQSRSSNAVAIKLSDDFLQRFAAATPDIYADEEKFLNFFKGLHITTDFGSATMLYINRISLDYFHHYTYTIKGSTGQDSTVTVNNIIPFPANEMVRQVNRFLHPDTASVVAQLKASPKQIHHVSSPANLFTRVQLPLRSMLQKLETEGRRTFINSARLRVDIDTLDAGELARPASGALLLVKESKMNEFFANKMLPTDSIALLGNYSYGLNKVTNQYEYFYEFDLAQLLAYEFGKAGHQSANIAPWSDYLLVPVRLTTNSSSYVTKVRHQILMNGVTIAGGQHPVKPMRIRTIYSQF